MKTDPKNSDYVVEAGASRNFEPWREKDSMRDAQGRYTVSPSQINLTVFRSVPVYLFTRGAPSSLA